VLKDRIDAGKQLAEKLFPLVKGTNAIVLSIPRGGVVVGKEIAETLSCQFDVIISKKITPPDHPEFAIGAIMHDGTSYLNKGWNEFLNSSELANERISKQREVSRRLEEFRGHSDYQLDNKTVILVDDGIATGSTVFVILEWLSEKNVKRIILATPVIPSDTFKKMQSLVDSIVALYVPDEFTAVGNFYKKFEQTTDLEVKQIITKFKNKISY